MDQIEKRELKGSAKQYKRNTGCEVGPGFRQHRTGDNDDEWIEEIKGGIYAAGCVDHRSGENQIGEHLDLGLHSPVALVVDNQKHLQHGDRIPRRDDPDEKTPVNIGGGKGDDCKLDCEQDRNDDDADLDKPLEPDPLVNSCSHADFPR